MARRSAGRSAARIGTKLEIDADRAAIVREIFERFADGASCRTIAQELNDRGVPSPGSTWKRKVRRCSIWMGSAVRVIVKNPLYTGMVRWNVSQFVRDPDSGKYKRRRRSQAEWHSYQDETLRVISDELFAKSQRGTAIAVHEPLLPTASTHGTSAPRSRARRIPDAPKK